MSSHVVFTFEAKPDQVDHLLEFLSGFQDRAIEAGAITASLMQNQDDPGRILEMDLWQSVDDYKRFLEAVTAVGALEPLEALLLAPYEVNYFDTVKYLRNRRLGAIH